VVGHTLQLLAAAMTGLHRQGRRQRQLEQSNFLLASSGAVAVQTIRENVKTALLC
jgi:hypothetical protein